MLWTYKDTAEVYELCNPIYLAEGVLISHDFDQTVRYIRDGIYHQQCYLNQSPMLNSNVNLVMNRFSQTLPVVQASWQQFIKDSNGGTFIFSVIPVIFSVSILSVITWFLTIFVMTNYTIKPSPLLRINATASSIYMLMTVIKSIVVLHEQQKHGYLHGLSLLESLNHLVYLNVIDMVVSFFLQINQAQVVMRLFLRQSDKRTVFLVGLFVSVCSQTMWGIMKFHKFHSDNEMEKILPAFTYLTRIAMGISYAAIYTAFMLTKLKTLMLHRNIWALSLLTLVLIYAPVIFFIADVSSTWVYEMSEVFSVATYVVCVVLPWEWCNQYNVIRKQIEKEGVLGRKFYEDELYELDKFEIFVEESDADTQDGSDNHTFGSRSLLLSIQTRDSHPGTSVHGVQKELSKFGFLSQGLDVAKNTFVSITDKIIATGLAIPRSLSTGSSTDAPVVNNSEMRSNGQKAQGQEEASSDSRQEELRNRVSRPANADSGPARARNVFVYSTKDVVIDMDD